MTVQPVLWSCRWSKCLGIGRLGSFAAGMVRQDMRSCFQLLACSSLWTRLVHGDEAVGPPAHVHGVAPCIAQPHPIQSQ